MPRVRAFGLIAAAFCIFTSGCEDKNGLRSLTGPTPTLEPTFSTIRAQIFESGDSSGRPSCVSCHTSQGRTPPAGLDLVNAPYEALVNRASVERPGLQRVAPGDTGNFNMGAAVGYMFRGIFGVELDLSLGRDFFEPEPNPGLVSDSRLGTVMGNLIVGIPVGGRAGAGFRPYATIGFGVIQTKVDDPGGLFDLENNEAGINIGGGAMVFFGNHIGVRGDIRYFRNLTTPGGGHGFNLHFRGVDV